MRITIIGVPGLGVDKVRDMFLKKWDMYKDITFNELEINPDVNKDLIQCGEAMLQEIKSHTSVEDCVCYETIPLELLITAINLNEIKEVTDETVKRLFEISLESMNYLDAVFIIPKSKQNALEDTSISQDEIDSYGAIYDLIIHAYGYGELSPFFNPNNCPGFIDIFGTDEQKMQLFSFYLKDDGTLQDDNLQNLLSPDQVKEGEKMLKSAIEDQKQATQHEAFYKKLKNYGK